MSLKILFLLYTYISISKMEILENGEKCKMHECLFVHLFKNY